MRNIKYLIVFTITYFANDCSLFAQANPSLKLQYGLIHYNKDVQDYKNTKFNNLGVSYKTPLSQVFSLQLGGRYYDWDNTINTSVETYSGSFMALINPIRLGNGWRINRIVPYLGAGIGYQKHQINHTIKADTSANTLYIPIEAGVNFNLSRMFSLGIFAEYKLARNESLKNYLNLTQTKLDIANSAGISLIYYFNKRRSKTAGQKIYTNIANVSALPTQSGAVLLVEDKLVKIETPNQLLAVNSSRLDTLLHNVQHLGIDSLVATTMLPPILKIEPDKKKSSTEEFTADTPVTNEGRKSITQKRVDSSRYDNFNLLALAGKTTFADSVDVAKYDRDPIIQLRMTTKRYNDLVKSVQEEYNRGSYTDSEFSAIQAKTENLRKDLTGLAGQKNIATNSLNKIAGDIDELKTEEQALKIRRQVALNPIENSLSNYDKKNELIVPLTAAAVLANTVAKPSALNPKKVDSANITNKIVELQKSNKILTDLIVKLSSRLDSVGLDHTKKMMTNASPTVKKISKPTRIDSTQTVKGTTEIDKTIIVSFGMNQSNIGLTDKNALLDFFSKPSAFGATSYVLSGYTDKSGNPAYNLRLSKKRVLAVKALLLAHGVRDEKIIMRFFGDQRATEQVNRNDRKVVIKMIFDKNGI